MRRRRCRPPSPPCRGGVPLSTAAAAAAAVWSALLIMSGAPYGGTGVGVVVVAASSPPSSMALNDHPHGRGEESFHNATTTTCTAAAAAANGNDEVPLCTTEEEEPFTLFTMLQFLLTPPPMTRHVLLWAYLLLEVGFFVLYKFVLVPNSNRRTVPAEYRDYGRDRHKLLLRILKRLERTHDAAAAAEAATNNDDGQRSDDDDPTTLLLRDSIESFLLSWFHHRRAPPKPPPNRNHKGGGGYDAFSLQLDDAYSSLVPPPPLLRLVSSRSSSLLSSDPSSVCEDANDDDDDDDTATFGSSSYAEEGGEDYDDGCEGGDFTTKVVKRPQRPALRRDNVNDFFAWAFFASSYADVASTKWMSDELDRIYASVQSHCDLTFEEGRNDDLVSPAMSLEDVTDMYRPLMVYGMVAAMRLSSSLVLWSAGFQRYKAQRGLTYWYRPAAGTKAHGASALESPRLPFLFFHGIAPGGHAPYLPLLLGGLLRGETRNRAVFLFENKPISYALSNDVVSEEHTVHGVVEALDQHVGQRVSVALCGHSFGSCTLTWLLRSPLMRHRIRSFILCDPVTICLSDPDVMLNFLYNRRKQERTARDDEEDVGESLRACVHRTKIRLLASSELYIQRYLRRNFFWYNSELWLEDVPNHVKVVVFLSENDEIIDAAKVLREVQLHNESARVRQCNGSINESSPAPMPVRERAVQVVHWKGAGHAHCITNPWRWRDVRDAIVALEEDEAACADACSVNQQ